MRFTGTAKEDEDYFGDIKFSVQPDGTVRGSWGGDFETTKKKHYLASAGFEGNTDPTRIYKDKTGNVDTTKLFMIAKGTYQELVTDYETRAVRRGAGKIYVVGWINKDLTVEGRMHMTVDKRTQRIYEWTAHPGRGTSTPALPGLPFGL
jgi:hypothetical protein